MEEKIKSRKIDRMNKYISISDCEICRIIEQKIHIDLQREQKIPSWVEDLSTIYKIDEPSHSYTEAIKMLKKCSLCGTYYSYERYKDEGEHFMDIPYDNVYITRWTPQRVLDFLSKNNMDEEFRELDGTYAEIIENFKDLLKDRIILNWHIKKYIIETLTDYYLLGNDWYSLEKSLLRHEDPVVRLETASDLLYITREEYPVWSIRYFNEKLKKAGRRYISRGKKWPVIVDVLRGIFQSESGETFYCHIDGYYKFTTFSVAVDLLGTAAYRKIDITEAIPDMLKLFSYDKDLNKRIWLNLYWYIKQGKENAQRVLDEIKRLQIDKNLEFLREVIKDSEKKLAGKSYRKKKNKTA